MVILTSVELQISAFHDGYFLLLLTLSLAFLDFQELAASRQELLG